MLRCKLLDFYSMHKHLQGQYNDSYPHVHFEDQVLLINHV